MGLVLPPRASRVVRSRRTATLRLEVFLLERASIPEGTESLRPRSHAVSRVLPLSAAALISSISCMWRSSSPEVPGSFSTVQPVESTGAGLPRLLRSVLRVSHPLDGFLLVRSTGPCFMPVRSWSSFPSERCPRSGAVSPLDETSTFLPSVPVAPPTASRPEKVCSSLETTVRDTPVKLGFKVLLPGSSSVAFTRQQAGQ